jgi:hypothetical protein
MLFATAMIWLSAIVDHPIDKAIVTRMMSPECARIGRIPPGSVLFATLPDDDICRSYFLYRATDHNAASDARSYTSLILHERVAEFWKRIGYVLLLWSIITGFAIGGVTLLRRLLRHS